MAFTPLDIVRRIGTFLLARGVAAILFMAFWALSVVGAVLSGREIQAEGIFQNLVPLSPSKQVYFVCTLCWVICTGHYRMNGAWTEIKTEAASLYNSLTACTVVLLQLYFWNNFLAALPITVPGSILIAFELLSVFGQRPHAGPSNAAGFNNV